jgi:hypothetical protein
MALESLGYITPHLLLLEGKMTGVQLKQIINKGGRPMHPLKRYNVAPGNWDNMTLRLCEQLEACKGESSRRLLMGVGIRKAGK